jgi:hypothetical protein
MKKSHEYRDLSPERMEELFSNFLINSWSYSKLSTFARNEKSFEMQYIYCEPPKFSASTISGIAYHSALQVFFTGLSEGDQFDIVDLERVAFEKIGDFPANKWKLQKTTPTIEECVNSATKTASLLLKNFMVEMELYTNEIDEILLVEEKLSQFLNVNGVDIPLPCNVVIDLVIKNKEGKVIIIDHKSKRSFSDDQEAKFNGAKQAVICALAFEEASDMIVDEVWFVENKYSKNRDKSPQLKPFKIKMDADTRRLYEAMLYEPLRRMLQAVGDPDYVYLINDNDSFVDRAELQEFWAKTMIAEVDDFNIPHNKRDIIEKRMKKIRDTSLATISPNIIKNFKKFTEQFIPYDLTNKDMKDEQKIEHILRSFGIVSQVKHKFNGFSSATYLVQLNAGTPISSIMRYKLDIANALNVSNVRIMKDLYIHEDKAYLAIESGIKCDDTLTFNLAELNGLRIPLGKDNFQKNVEWDLDNPSTPHMLVCGATGSGKSVFLRSTIEYARAAGVTNVILFDPKFEFVREYTADSGVKIYSDISDIENKMKELVEEMDGMVKSGETRKTLVVFDEFADAVANSRKGKELDIIEEVQIGTYAPKKLKGMFGETLSEAMPKMGMKKTGELKSLEENLRILLQKGRSTGFRIIAATQRASVKVITGDAKVNFPVQVCFRVPKEVDSKVVIDEAGAELLKGKGDGLIKSPEYLDVIRFQAFYKA